MRGERERGIEREREKEVRPPLIRRFSFCCFRYYNHQEAVDCMRLISGTKLDERIIRCDLDPGYTDGRQYGRGKSGGQVRDEHRQEYDAGRGGWGHNKLREEEEERRRVAEEEEERRRAHHDAVYTDQERELGGRIIPDGAEGRYEEREERGGGSSRYQESSRLLERKRERSSDEGNNRQENSNPNASKVS